MNSNTKVYPAPLLTGQHNFRGLGGIPSRAGGKIKSGVLFRSGDLHSLSKEDVRFLELAGIAMIIDFRSETERLVRPNRKICSVKTTVHLPIHDAPRKLASEYVREGNEAGLNHLLVYEYQRIIREYTHEYREFLRILASPEDFPVLYQCSAGKDRTGLATLFLLTALDVDMDSILGDYYATNHYAQAHATEIIGILEKEGFNGKLMQPLLEVRPEYLEAALSEIKEQAGSLEKYVRETLQADTQKLRKKFLTS